MALIYTWFRLLLGSVVLYTSSAVACTLPTDSLGNAKLFPQQVRERFCNPEAGYISLLLIRAAVNKSTPVFRTIAVRKDGSDQVQSVRLYQFDKDGNDHPDVAGEPQAVIDFNGSSPMFQARVKGKKTTISFAERTFKFNMRGLYRLRIKQDLDAEGRITIGGKPIFSSSYQHVESGALALGSRRR